MVDGQFKVGVETELPLPPARFDDSATAKAQPVEPISQSRFSNQFGQKGSVWGMITTKSRALAVIVIAGLATGTLGGIALVNHSARTAQTISNEPVSTILNTNNPLQEFGTAEVGARGLLATGAAGNRRNTRSRERTGGAQRAYRVTVIR